MRPSWLSIETALPDEEFHTRHRGLVLLLLAHLVALPIFGVCMGFSLPSALLICLPAAAFAAAAAAPGLSRAIRSISCVLGLLCCSAALVWLWHGRTEAHFHYFVIVGAVALYEAALPFAIAILFVVLQHGLMALWRPERVFGSMGAMHHPWLWAGVHGGFVAALAVANLVSMRANHRTRARERAASDQSLVSARRFERAFADAPGGAALLDHAGTVLAVNRALGSSLRASPTSLLGRRWLELIDGGDRASGFDRPAVSWPPPAGAEDLERRFRVDGCEAWMLVTYSRLGDGERSDWYAQTLDISRRREAERRLAHQAMHDPLTGLLNRRTFVERAQAALERNGDEGLCVLFVDVDDFKIINDSLGHTAGDQLLRAVAERLSATVRAGDLVGRFGGDEFVICLSEPSPDAADATAQRLIQAFAEPFPIAGVERTASASIGVALARAGERSMESLLRDADLAMYEAKSSGKDRHTWFDLEMRERAIDRQELESDLRGAVARGEIEAFYQPQVGPDGEIRGFEALARWRHPERGLISPTVFIPIAEASDLVGEIGAHVLRVACRQARDWAREDPRLAALTISANASPRCMGNEDLPAIVGAILEQTGVAPERVCIEITETAVVTRTERVGRVMAGLKALGVRLAIDDFGAGESSLAQLTRLGSLDELKIDKLLIDGIATSTTAARIVAAIIEVAVGDGVNVVAEGVEHAEQLEVLRALGGAVVQGYLYSPPVPAERFRALLVAPRLAAA